MSLFRFQQIFLLVTLFFTIFEGLYCSDNDKKPHPLGEGHGMPFGKGKPSKHVAVIEGFPTPKDFFMKYVRNPTAVLMKGAILNTRAHKLWSDDYFLSLSIPGDDIVTVESRKKENRSLPATEMHFKSFVEVYNYTDQYMVNPVPDFLRADLMLPGPLQCTQIIKEAVVEMMMWFSSGGTKSVVHTDSVENINCLVRGRKEFVFVHPKYKSLVLMDHPEGAYSGIDVDSVDYDKYPGLAQVEFEHASMKAGDCLYIPFKWIHQVESFDRNLAVNIWWDKFKNEELNLDACPETVDESMSLDKVEIQGFGSLDTSPAVMRDHIEEHIGQDINDFDSMMRALVEDHLSPEWRSHPNYDRYLVYAKRAFDLIDTNSDGKLDKGDLVSLQNDEWMAIATSLAHAGKLSYESLLELDNEGKDHDEL